MVEAKFLKNLQIFRQLQQYRLIQLQIVLKEREREREREKERNQSLFFNAAMCSANW